MPHERSAQPTDEPWSLNGLQPPTDWTACEKDLWRRYRDGEELDLSDPDPTRNDPVDGGAWDEHRQLRASVVAHLLLNPPNQNPGNTPRFIVIGARITGKLDLGCGNAVPFSFHGCRFDNTPNLNDMTASFVGFSHCHLPSLSADRITNSGPVWLQGSHVNSSISFEDAEVRGEFDLSHIKYDGPDNTRKICLCGATVGGDLLLKDSTVSGVICLVCTKISGNLIADDAEITSSTTAILARQAEIGGSFRADGHFKCTGGISMEGAKIAGQLIMNDAELSANGRPSLKLDHAKVDLGIFLRKVRSKGPINMHHTLVGCQVSFRDAKLSNPGELALRADHLVVDGSLLFFGETEIAGQVNLHGAKISCTLNLREAKIDAKESVAVKAEGIHVGHDIIAKDCRIKGHFQLRDATVGGSIVLTSAHLENPDRYALSARRMRVTGRIDMLENFSARGTVSLADATVGTNFSFDDGKFSEANSRACLDIAGLQVHGDIVGNRACVDGLFDAAALKCAGDVRLADTVLNGVPANASSLGSSVDRGKGGPWRGISLRMTGAVVGGDLDLRGATLKRSLMLTKATVSHSIMLTEASLSGTEEGALIADGLTVDSLALQFKSLPAGTVNLTSAHVSTLSDGNTSWPTSASICIDGFKYERLDSALNASARLNWLVNATAKYMPQPYEQLASYYVANGNLDEARRIRLESIRRSYKIRTPLARLWGLLQDWTLGFGYRPFRTVIIFFALWLAGSIWFAVGVGPCARFGVRWTNLCPDALTGHPSWNPVLYSFDLLVPVINLGFKTAWDPVGISRIISFGLIVSGWVLTTTIVAAASRNLRRP